MGSENSGSAGKVTIIVALIGLFGTILTLVINNWDKIFGATKHTVQTNITSQNFDTTNKSTDTFYNQPKETDNSSTNEKIDYKEIARTLCRQWWNDIGNNNVDGLMFYSAVPFSPDKKDIINSQSALRSYYTELSTGNPRPDIFSIEIDNAAELKQKGLLTEKADTLFGNLGMGTDPLLGIISWKRQSGSVETAMVYFKQVDKTLKIVGFED